MDSHTDIDAARIRDVFEATVLRWPNVRTRKMFGSPAYLANGKLFAFFVSDALVLTRLRRADREEIAGIRETRPFETGRRTISGWVQTPVAGDDDLDALMPFITASYETALDASLAEND